MVIMAHPDDPEFFCGGTIALLGQQGVDVSYLLLTRGEKGSDDLVLDDQALIETRRQEQRAAARRLGVRDIRFLDYRDGELENTAEVRRDVVQVIRRQRPELVITNDPAIVFFVPSGYVNHADHRAAGYIAIDAVFPAAGNARFFPELLAEGLEPHKVREIWLARSNQSDMEVDISTVYDLRLEALLEHKSQIGDPDDFVARMRKGREDAGEPPLETFKRLVMR
jgi:LmbE family N-acetylglucosaminyl deacetylase